MTLIPPERLAAATLAAIIEGFILREGTEYGAQETALMDKVEQVRRQITSGRVLIVYDDTSESCNLVTIDEYRQSLLVG